MKDYHTKQRQEFIKNYAREYYTKTLEYILDSRPIPEKLLEALLEK